MVPTTGGNHTKEIAAATSPLSHQTANPPSPSVAIDRLVVRNVLIALAYAVLAIAALSLITPSGYTSPLWPAAGFALAVILMGGLRCWPGIWLGAFIVDLSLDVSWSGAVVAGLLAAGITLQALIGARLTRRFLTVTQPLAQEYDIWRFLILAAPVTCVVAASVNTLVLFLFERMTAGDGLAQWLLWWTGDTLGVLLFTPLVLLIWPGSHSLWLHGGKRVALPLLVTAALMGAGHVGLAQLETSKAKSAADQLMDNAYEAHVYSLSRLLEPLRSLKRFLITSEEVTREEYAIFTADLTDQEGLLSVDWAPRVPLAERTAFEMAQRNDGQQDYRIFELDAERQPQPPAERSEYFPVRHTAPMAGNEAVIGLDHGFEEARRKAMAHAAETGEIIATSVISLLRTQRYTLLTFQAVYPHDFDLSAASERERNAALHGFIVGAFDIDTLFASLARETEQHRIAFRVSDVTPGYTTHLLAGNLTADTLAEWERTIRFGDRYWLLEMHLLDGYWQPGATLTSRIYFGFSVLAALLIAFSALSAAGRQAATEEVVAARTVELEAELSARRKIQAALRESENNLDITLQSIGDAVLTTDADGCVTRMNPIAEKLTGWPLAEAMGRPIEEVFHIINEKTRLPSPIPVEKVLRTGKIHGLANHTVVISRDGHEFHIADSAAPICDQDGNVLGVVLVFRDVGKEREAEQALLASETRHRELIEHSPLGIFIQCAGRFVFMNPKAVSLLGAHSPDDLIGKKVLDFIHPDSRDAVHERIRQLNNEDKGAPPLEETWLRLDGSSFCGEAAAVPYLHEGEPAALVLLQDVTTRKEADKLLTQARLDAEQANRAKSAFLATMSHEIRTPMNGVIGMVEILSQSRLSAHQTELVNTIHESATALLTIIDDILNFSKIEAGRLEIENIPVSVPDIVEGLCNSLVPVAAAKGVNLNLFISPRIPPRLLSDDVRLRQLLYNLIGNAIKFSGGNAQRPGRVSIRVDIATENQTLLFLSFRIADNGIGMKPETLDNLFTPFTQAEVSTTRRFGGTGLGLTICQRLVDLMDGTITAESSLDEGSVFTVTLPMQNPGGEPESTDITLDGLDCILIEDPHFNASDLCIYLEHAGAKVVLVDDIDKAVELASRYGDFIVVIQYAGRQEPDGHDRFDSLPKVRHLWITQGRRRRARVEKPDVVSLDGDALRRHALLRAVAVAAGRASPEVFHDHREDDFTHEETVTAPTVAEARSQGRLILIAEDDDLNQRVILQQLRLLGYAGEVAANGEEALRLWREGSYALLLTDLHMPEMDGYSLAQIIRQEERGARLPIVALTANALRGEESRAKAVGMDAYLTKPVPLKKLRTMLEEWLSPPPSEIATDTLTDEGGLPHSGQLLDISLLMQLVGDDPVTVHEFLAEYLKTADTLVQEMESAFTAGDVRHVSAIAHKLKSSSRSVGALILGDLCAGIENAGKEGDRTFIAEQLHELRSIWLAVKHEIHFQLSPQSPRPTEGI
ncbi:CHASE domain-containing protein [Haliea sp. E1-2-M8]|uniref:CHASE domain-containing protein n=1 Tax=Haliea sp. E1-2-M8 TaxID=3064706 RepID=UPI00271F0897|nr:CHASE domain-containing protein [Haliea sp. E1-2-M8]MDO8862007.1 CHASE domain-containing protein [Haliea sp. E1-2-M8]